MWNGWICLRRDSLQNALNEYRTHNKYFEKYYISKFHDDIAIYQKR